MVKFNIAKADLKYLFNVTKSSMGCVGRDKKCQYVKCTGRDSHLQAFSLDGYRAHIAAAPIDILEGNQHFSFLLKPFALPATNTFFIQCSLDKEKGEIMFDFGNRKFIETLGEGDGEFFNIEQALPKDPPAEQIGINPKYIVDAVQSFRRNARSPVVFEIRSPTSPIIIRSSEDPNDFRLVMPTRVTKAR